MPLVRIDIPAATSDADAGALSRAVHAALVEHFTVPPDDLFQVIARRAPGEIVCTPEYLGVRHTDHVAFIQVFLAPGRTVGRKEAFYAQVARDGVRYVLCVPGDHCNSHAAPMKALDRLARDFADLVFQGDRSRNPGIEENELHGRAAPAPFLQRRAVDCGLVEPAFGEQPRTPDLDQASFDSGAHAAARG